MLMKLENIHWYENIRDNLSVASAVATERVTKARQAGATRSLGDALLGRGLIHGLQGNYSAARQCFAEVEDLRPQDTLRVWQAKSYAYVMMRQRYGYFPDGGDTSALDIDQQFDALKYAQPTVKQLDQLRQRLWQKGIDVTLEHSVVDGWLTSLLSARATVSKTHTTPEKMRLQLLETSLTSVWLPLRAAKPQHHPHLHPHGYWLAADLCHRANHYSQAQQYLQQAQQQYQQLNDKIGVTLCQMTAIDWQIAPMSTPLVWNCIIEEGHTTSELRSALEQQEFVTADLDLTTIALAYRQIRDQFAEAGAQRAIGQTELRLAFVAVLQGAYEEAETWLDAAETHLTHVGDQMALQYVHMQRALIGIAAKHMPERRDLAQRVGHWGQKNGAFAFTLGLGILCLRMGRYWLMQVGSMEQALAAFRLAEHLFTTLDAPISLARALTDRAAVYQLLGEINAAGRLFEQAATLLLQQLNASHTNYEMLLYRLIYLEKEAIQLYARARDADGIERAVKQIRQLQPYLPFNLHERDENAVMMNLRQQVAMGKIDEAEAMTQLGTGMQLTTLLDDAAVNIPLYRAKQAKRAGNKKEAEHYFAQALQVARQANDALNSDLCRMRLVGVLGSMGKNEEAETLFRQTIQLGESKTAFNQWVEKLDLRQKFDELLTQRDADQHINAASFFVRIQRYQEAEEQFKIVEDLKGNQWWRNQPRPWEILMEYGELYEGLKQYDQALTYFDQAIGILESHRSQLRRDELKIALMGDQHSSWLYLQAARTALKAIPADPARRHHYLSHSFRYVEAGKGRALLDLMNISMSAAQTPGITTKHIAQWRALTAHLTTWQVLLARAKESQPPDSKRITEFEGHIATTEAELHQLETRLSTEKPNFYQLLNPQSQQLTLDQTMAALPPNTLLIQYFFDDQTLLIWTLSGNGRSDGHYIETDTFALNRQVRRFYDLCANPNSPLAEIEAIGVYIADVLLTPIDTLLTQHQRIIFMPHALLHRLPFHALRWRGKLLVETHIVSYRPNASTLRYVLIDQPITTPIRILAVGNPSNMGVPLYLEESLMAASSLLGAEKEVEQIAATFPRSLCLTRQEATEDNIRQQLHNFNILHFGTHGYLSPEAPMLSSILLANGEALTVAELAGMELDVELVVLSACSTALGQQTSGDEIVGLTRGLLGAGARAAIVTIWPVSDESTPNLMGPLYQNLKQNKPPAYALQAAQQHMLHSMITSQDNTPREIHLRDLAHRGVQRKQQRDYRHPFYWAPFILIG